MSAGMRENSIPMGSRKNQKPITKTPNTKFISPQPFEALSG